MNHYLFKYSIQKSINLFKDKRVTSIGIHSFSSFSVHFKDCNYSLYINLSPQSSFVFPINKNIPTTKSTASQLFVFLKKKLPGMVLRLAYQKNSERYAYFYLEDVRGDITNRFIMVIEMIDRLANLVFTDENFIILQAYKYTDSARIISPHKKYEPPFSDMLDILNASMDNLIARFKHKENILGINGALKRILKNEKEFINFVETARTAFEKKELSLYVYNEKSVYPFRFLDNAKKTDDEFVLNKFILKPQADDFENRKKNVRNTLTKKLNAVKRKFGKIKNELINAEDSDKYRIIAENLLSNPNIDTAYKNNITLKDIYSGKDLTILLNPKLNLFENAQNYFKKFKKAKKGKKIIEKRLKQTQYDMEFIEQLLFDAENALNDKEIEDVKNIMIKEGVIKTNTKKIKQENYVPYEHKKIEGFDIYIGKNARGNDYVTMKLANKNDLWFHPHGRPGAHLILKNPSRLQNIDDNVKMKCALEVAKKTKAQDGEKVDIDYTFVKHIKKPKGLRVGMVLYANFKTLRVEKNESD